MQKFASDIFLYIKILTNSTKPQNVPCHSINYQNKEVNQLLTTRNKVTFSRSAPTVPAKDTKKMTKPTATSTAPGSVAVLVNSV